MKRQRSTHDLPSTAKDLTLVPDPPPSTFFPIRCPLCLSLRVVQVENRQYTIACRCEDCTAEFVVTQSADRPRD
jgi:ribosomal protein S27E